LELNSTPPSVSPWSASLGADVGWLVDWGFGVSAAGELTGIAMKIHPTANPNPSVTSICRMTFLTVKITPDSSYRAA
jgi:hypothetical protein